MRRARNAHDTQTCEQINRSANRTITASIGEQQAVRLEIRPQRVGILICENCMLSRVGRLPLRSSPRCCVNRGSQITPSSTNRFSRWLRLVKSALVELCSRIGHNRRCKQGAKCAHEKTRHAARPGLTYFFQIAIFVSEKFPKHKSRFVAHVSLQPRDKISRPASAKTGAGLKPAPTGLSYFVR
jgi:hypothetical protein